MIHAVGEGGGGDPGEAEVEEVDDVAAAEVFPEAVGGGVGQEVALQEAVRHVADDAGEDEGPGEFQQTGAEVAAAVEDDEEDEGGELDAEEDVGGPEGAVAEAEGDAAVVHAHDVKAGEGAVEDGAVVGAGVGRGEVEHDPPLAHLVEHVEQDDEEDEAQGAAARGRGDGVAHGRREMKGGRRSAGPRSAKRGSTGRGAREPKGGRKGGREGEVCGRAGLRWERGGSGAGAGEERVPFPSPAGARRGGGGGDAGRPRGRAQPSTAAQRAQRPSSLAAGS